MPTKVPWQSPPDEIPGTSTYIYGELRLRRADEFTNAWKDEQVDLTQYGIPNDASRGELSRDLQVTRLELGESEKTRDELENETVNLSNELHVTEQELDTETKKKYLVEDKFNKEAARTSILTQHLRTFGYHTSDCQKMDVASSGRLIDLDEIECTCGWDEIDTKDH